MAIPAWTAITMAFRSQPQHRRRRERRTSEQRGRRSVRRRPRRYAVPLRRPPATRTRQTIQRPTTPRVTVERSTAPMRQPPHHPPSLGGAKSPGKSQRLPPMSEPRRRSETTGGYASDAEAAQPLRSHRPRSRLRAARPRCAGRPTGARRGATFSSPSIWNGVDTVSAFAIGKRHQRADRRICAIVATPR